MKFYDQTFHFPIENIGVLIFLPMDNNLNYQYLILAHRKHNLRIYLIEQGNAI